MWRPVIYLIYCYPDDLSVWLKRKL